tara:strand:- start:125 stop:355 length:231 start_codon:yes stop_codon:yes gene_type:complete
MKVNYEKLKELNLGALTEKGDQLNCYWVLQSAVERYLDDGEVTQKQINLLKELGILIDTEEEKKTDLLNHKFTTNG